MPTILTETRPPGAFILREAEGRLSRQAGRLLNLGGGALTALPGLVLASAAAGADTVVTAGDANAGDGSLALTGFGGAVRPGTYTLVATSSSHFSLVSPKGVQMGVATVDAELDTPALSLLIAAGGTPFAAGDTFTIAVPASSDRYVPWVNAAPAVAILFGREDVAAGGSVLTTLIARAAQVRAGYLVYDPSITGSVSPTPAELAAIAVRQLGAVGGVIG
jgi:hypothetical protein